MTALAEAGIRLPDERPGKRRMPCPQCDKGRSDDALEVTVTARRWVFWHCYRDPSHDGRAPLDDEPPSRPPQQHQPPRPASARRPDGLSSWAQRFRQGCMPIKPGTLAYHYLVEIRGCILPPNDLLWHPEVLHRSGYVGPALVAVITDIITGEPISLHRTWLKPDGSGKAEVDPPRMALKHHRTHGGCIRLWEDAEVTYRLALAEGIETALSVARVFQPVWATIDAGNMRCFPVLPSVDNLLIVADHDPAGIAAAEECAERWAEVGCEVLLWKAGAEGVDFNDIARRAA